MKTKYCMAVVLLVVMIPFQTLAHGDLDVISLSYRQETEAIEINIQIPVLAFLEDKDVQDQYNTKLMGDILDFVREIEGMANDYSKDAKENNWPSHRYAAWLVPEVTNTGRVFSMIIDYYQYTGGAHGLTTRVSYNIDSKTQKNLSLGEFLSLTNLGLDEVNSNIHQQIKNSSDDYFPNAIETLSISDDQRYYVDGEYLVVYFQQYEIAPYATGMPEFRILFSYI